VTHLKVWAKEGISFMCFLGCPVSTELIEYVAGHLFHSSRVRGMQVPKSFCFQI